MGLDKKKKRIIGEYEDISLPEWGIRRMRARVDTGASISAIHVENICLLPHNRASFDVVIGWKKTQKKKVHVVAHVRRLKRIRPTTGESKFRWIVTTKIVLGSQSKQIELGLADRGKMTFRMLLGRAALRGDFLVDPARRCLLGKEAPSSTS